jgi:aquaporin Z
MAEFSYVKRCLAEFIGAYLLVFTIGCNVIGGNTTFGAFSVACMYMVSIYAFGAISGAHFNPAVSIAVGTAGKMERGFKAVLVYIVAQLGGAIAAGLSFRVLYSGTGITLGPVHSGQHIAGALLCELIYTLILCFTFLNTVASKAKGGKNQYFGLATGFVIIAGAYGAGPVGAGCFNPAVAVGLVSSSLFQVGHKWLALFAAVEILGAILAVVLFRHVRPEETKDDDDEPAVEVVKKKKKAKQEPQLSARPGQPGKLSVSIISATGLQHLNMMGDKMYVLCQVLDAETDQPKREQNKRFKCETKIIAKTLEPVWDESFMIDWSVGDSVEFIICDQGLLGARTEGTVAMWSENFYPHGFKGALPVAGLDHATLNLHMIPHVPVEIYSPRGVEEEDESDEEPPPKPREDKEVKLETKLVCEFMGTYLVAFTLGLNVLGQTKAGAFSIAAAYMVMMYAVGDISGGHFNPAVTLAVYISGRGGGLLQIKGDVLAYWAVQVLGAILGAFTYVLAHDNESFPLGPGAGHAWGQLIFVETLFTFLLVFVVLSITVVDSLRGKDYTCFIVASCITAGAGAAGTISGGTLNPAVSIGVSTSHLVAGGKWYECLIYAFFELLAAIVAASLFKVLYREQLEKEADGEGKPLLKDSRGPGFGSSSPRGPKDV